MASEPVSTRGKPSWRVLLVSMLVGLLAACATPPPLETPQHFPEGASGHSAKPGWTSRHFMVAAAHPLATEAGYRMLRAGGSALDAAIAVQMVLALVEPQSSGIGGGALLLHWDGQALQAWDGRETAPAAADEALFLQADGQPMPFMAAVVGGRAVGVPGAVRMLEAAHRQQGRLPWAALFAPAIALAEQGFAVSPRLHALLQAETALREDAQARAYFYGDDGAPRPVGYRLRNPALAAVLRALAAQGSAALHEGAVAADIAARVRGHARNPGRLSEADLAGYTPKLREALCSDWREIYRVCGFPPPSSGPLAVMQILGLLEHRPAPARADFPFDADWLHEYTEASRLAYADRAQYVADPDFVAPPAGRWSSLLDASYLKQRAAAIGPRRMKTVAPGVPAGASSAWAPQAEQAEFGTSQIAVVDAEGRAVSMTTTIESAFGARLMSDGGTGLVGGFLLNNELTDFSFAPRGADARTIANRVQPGKRPRSSMSPTLVFDRRDGRLLMSLGSPGGAAIIHYVAKTLLGSLAWGLDAQRAVALPNFGSLGGATLLEAGRFSAPLVQALQVRGHEVQETELTSGVQAIARHPPGWFGAADPRREGVAMGD